MTEEILRIRAEELTTLRVTFAEQTGVVHELPIGEVRSYLASCQDRQLREKLNFLADALQFFVDRQKDYSLEFSVPLKK